MTDPRSASESGTGTGKASGETAATPKSGSMSSSILARTVRASIGATKPPVQRLRGAVSAVSFASGTAVRAVRNIPARMSSTKSGEGAHLHDDEIWLVPRWAVIQATTGGAFDIKVSVQAACIDLQDISVAGLSQKAVVGIAKRVIDLADVPDQEKADDTSDPSDGGDSSVSKAAAKAVATAVTDIPTEPVAESAEDGSPLDKVADRPAGTVAPTPDGVPQQTVDTDPERLSHGDDRGDSNADRILHEAGHPEAPAHAAALPIKASRRAMTTTKLGPNASVEDLQMAHRLMNERLRPFWGAPLHGRDVQISLHAVRMLEDGRTEPPIGSALWEHAPLIEETHTTGDEGFMQVELDVPWTTISNDATSRSAGLIDALKSKTDVGIVVRAQLLQSDATPQAEAVEVLHLSREDGVRLISDLDDTVKYSDILGGLREVFRNVFCVPSEDLLVPGMDSLYASMAHNGLEGVHFVSNSPVELLPAISEFLVKHDFPSSSISLKLYGTRSLLTSLFQGAGERKRPGLEEVIGAFPKSRFILVGDSGEQDLEIYTAMAVKHTAQVAGIFIHDVTTGRSEPLHQLAADVDATGSPGASASLGVSTAERTASSRMPGAWEIEDYVKHEFYELRHGPAAEVETSIEPPTPVEGDSSHTPASHGDPDNSHLATAAQPMARTISSTSTTSSAISGTSSVVEAPEDERKTVADLEAIRTGQEKLHALAQAWNQRIATAHAVLPPSVKLHVFTDPKAIEKIMADLVEESQGP